MAWKNLKKLSLADSLDSDHEALTEPDDIHELMDWEDIEHLLGDINAKQCMAPCVYVQGVITAELAW